MDGRSSTPADASHGDQGEQGGHHGPGGRLQFVAEGEVSFERKTENVDVSGKIDITRATYNEKAPVHTYRANPVFEVTLYKWKGNKRDKYRAFLQVTDGMEMMVPQRRAHDLRLRTPGVTPPVPQPSTRHVPPAMLAGTSYPETLNTGQLLPRIKRWLHDQGVLRDFFEGTDRPNLVLREIESAFSPESLRNQHTSLLGSGVQRWIPIPQPFGGTKYLWIKVNAQIGAAQSQLPRVYATGGVHPAG
jgi:hypothetical protein